MSRAPRLTLMAIAALAAVAVVVSGCGGGSSSGGSSSRGSTAAAGSSSKFINGAEAACVSANEEIAALGTPQQAEVLQYLEKTETVIEELHSKVEAIVGSGSAEAAYVEALGKSVIVLNHMTNAARNENFDAVREISDELIEFKVGELAEAASLRSCAEVPVETE